MKLTGKTLYTKWEKKNYIPNYFVYQINSLQRLLYVKSYFIFNVAFNKKVLKSL